MLSLRLLSFCGVGLLACNGAVSTPASGAGDTMAPEPAAASTTSPPTTSPPPESSSNRASESPDVLLSPADMTRTWVKLAVPRSTRAAPHIVQTSVGFVAIAAEQTSPAPKLIGPTYNYLYRSADGINWTKLTPPAPATPDQGFELVGIAYGAGHYVVATNRQALMTSTDLAQWTTPALDVSGIPSPAAPDIQIITRLNGRFFAMGHDAIFTSNDGVTFTTTSDPLVQALGIAFGNGQFMLADHFSIQASTDGLAWSDHSPSCSIGPCVAVPGQPAPVPGLFGHIAFLDRFYVDDVASADGVSWEAYAGPTVDYVVGGYAFNTSGGLPYDSSSDVLRAWRAGEAPQTISVEIQAPTATLAGGVAPAVISNPLPGGETCSTHSCVVVGRELYLLR